MARYIDADKLIAEYDRVHIGVPGGARKLMVEAPTADVAPKVEDHLKQCTCYTLGCQMAEELKSEIAIKICCEIEEEIVAALESNYKVRAERMESPRIDTADEFISYIDGKIATLRGIKDFVENIKNKHTEEHQ